MKGSQEASDGHLDERGMKLLRQWIMSDCSVIFQKMRTRTLSDSERLGEANVAAGRILAVSVEYASFMVKGMGHPPVGSCALLCQRFVQVKNSKSGKLFAPELCNSLGKRKCKRIPALCYQLILRGSESRSTFGDIEV